MVHCTQCGSENKDEAKFCSSCGAALGSMEHRGRIEHRKKPKDECFGLPHGGAIFGLFIGVIIILWGLSSLLGLSIEISTFAIIAFIL